MTDSSEIANLASASGIVTFAEAWANALTFARRASAHYSMSEREQELLFDIALGQLPRKPKIVELGVCNGKTAIILAWLARWLGGQYFGIDHWGLEGSHEMVMKLLAETKLDSVSTLISGDTREVPLIENINLLLIDAGHDEANVSVDCQRWIPCVKSGGLVAFDDYPSDAKWVDSCHWAVREYADFYTRDWDLVLFWNKLLVRRRPTLDKPPA